MQYHLKQVSVRTIPEAYWEPSQIWCKEVSIPLSTQTGILASSGKGKSTLINVLAGIRHDYDGAIALGEQPLTKVSQQADFYASTIAVVWQDLRLVNHLTGQENIQLAHQVLKDNPTSLDELKSWAIQLGVHQVWDKPATLLSFGERQRISIIRALAKPFRFLLLDEPFSHLDRQNALLAAQLIQEQCARHQAGYLVTTLDPDTVLPITSLLKL